MFDKLIDTLLQFLDQFRFWQVVNEFERGVVLRFGRYNRELEPGLHWLLPFSIDSVLLDNVCRRTENLKTQGLTTRDGKVVSVGIAVAISIKNIKTALLEVEGVDHALRDACSGALGSHVANHTYDELRASTNITVLTKTCREEALQYGIKIHRVQITDLIVTRGIHLYQMTN